MFLPPLLEHSGVGILLMDVRGMVVVMVVWWGRGVLKSVSLLPVPLQIAEAGIFFSKKGKKTCSLCGTGGFFFFLFFTVVLQPYGVCDSDTAEQQSLNIRAAGTVWVEKSCAAAVCVCVMRNNRLYTR